MPEDAAEKHGDQRTVVEVAAENYSWLSDQDLETLEGIRDILTVIQVIGSASDRAMLTKVYDYIGYINGLRMGKYDQPVFDTGQMEQVRQSVATAEEPSQFGQSRPGTYL